MRKYLSIKNYDNKKFINEVIQKNPNMDSMKFVLQEKIHGSNIRLHCFPNGDFFLGSRNRILKDGEDHMGLKILFPEKVRIKLLEYSKNIGDKITIYGELFGSNIQKGVDYGNKKRILFFDLRIGDEDLLTYIKFREIIEKLNLQDFMVPIYKESVKGFLNAINTTSVFTSFLSPTNSEAEGYVAKPMDAYIFDKYGEMTYIKNKNPLFKERKSMKKNRKNKSRFNDEFNIYITQNRVEGVVLKYGGIKSKKEIFKFIQLIINDALKDFQKDCGYIPHKINAGSLIAKYLRVMLEK